MIATLPPPMHTSRNVTRATRRSREDGIAIILVLAFIVILTGLVFAFFSRTITERQVANSSVNQSKADILARSAVDIIIGDLKQEIVDGSASPAPIPATGVTLYFPKTSASMLPQTSGTPTPSPSPGSSGVNLVPNLVRRSVHDDLLAKTTASPAPTPGFKAITTSASFINSTTDPSANNRNVTLARWNSHYLIPRHDTSVTIDSTPISPLNATGSEPNGFTPPDWVVVSAERGPVVLSTPRKDSVGNTVTPIGRYAYAIYDEGGLLDANVVAYPSNSDPKEIGQKASLAFADISQLPLTISQTYIDSLVGWRNYASAQPANPSSLLYTFTAAAAKRYTDYTKSNTNGFLSVNPQTFNSRTDQAFSSRQALLNFRRSTTLATGGTALSQNILQYLGTFSRGLNQPSFIRVQSVDSTAPGYDATAPKILAAAAGGNNATGLDSAINPSFLAVRVAGSNPANIRFLRNDGTPAFETEPLVKNRFNLNRLAWLTCRGPSAGRSLGEADMAQLVANGLTSAFLSQGTDANIQKYFGLTWDTSNPATPPRWKYVHGRNGSNGPIMKLSYAADSNDVVRANREPDFFELLKSSINVGSLGKTLTAPGPPSVGDTAFQAQYNADSSVDYAIMQIGANIIDQFDTDGFPTRIYFDDGSAPREFRGVENLPYIYRVRDSLIKVAAPTLAANANPYGGSENPSDAQVITNTGVGAFMHYPDLWNPHDWNASNSNQINQTLGYLGPTQFRIYATTSTAVALNAHTGGTPPGANPSSGTNATDQAASPGFNSLYGFPWVGELRSLTQSNTEMTFQVNRDATGAGLFREPTILFQPGKPTGSSLASTVISNSNKTGLGILGGGPFFAGGGIKSDVDTTDATGLPKKDDGYIGFYIGTHPLQWRRGSSGGTTPVAGMRYGARQSGFLGTATLTYTLQCQDANGQWVTYDEKTRVITGNPNDNIMKAAEVGFIHNQQKFGNMATVMDPRTSRFNLMPTYVANGAGLYRFPPWTKDVANDSNKTGWLNKSEGIVLSNRNGFAGGVVVHGGELWSPTTLMGWYPGGWASGNGGAPFFQIGLFSQNDPNFTPQQNLSDQLGTSGDGTPTGAGSPTYYADPDGVVRRASGGYNATATPAGGTSTSASTAPGLPLATANTTGKTRAGQSDSRPMILNRPFRTVSELGYVMSATPWKNLNFLLPESGDAALLDVFSTQDTDDPNALVAGRVNLNTRQVPVLQAVIAGAYRDEWNPGSTTIPSGASSLAQRIAQQLVTRTTVGPTSGPNIGKPTPLDNLSELVGKWVSSTSAPSGGVDGSKSYDGFSADLSTVLPAGNDATVQRFREATLRALSGSGQTRIWNLMIDLVAQTGRYPQNAITLDKFIVEGEQRFWVHLAIDRYTGNVIDKQIEVVKE